MSSVSGSSGGSSSSGGKHKLPKDGELDPLASDSTVSSKRARHAVVANSAFADAPLLSSFSNSASSVTLSSPSAPSPTAVSAVSAGEASAASLKSSFQSFAASLPPACSELMNVGIPQQILAMHAYLQQMPRFEHSVSVPGDDNDTQPVDPTTLPPLTQSTALAVAAAHASPDPPSISSPPPRVPIAVSVSSPLPCHPQLSSFLPFLHSTLSTLLVHLSTLKLNLQLLIPPSDDSNTFGVEIQTETLSHLTAYDTILTRFSPTRRNNQPSLSSASRLSPHIPPILAPRCLTCFLCSSLTCSTAQVRGHHLRGAGEDSGLRQQQSQDEQVSSGTQTQTHPQYTDVHGARTHLALAPCRSLTHRCRALGPSSPLV